MSHDHRAQALGNLAGWSTGQQREQAILDPFLGLRTALRVEHVRRAPQVFEDMGDVELDRDLDAGFARSTLDPLDLVRLAIDKHDPPTFALRIATQALRKRVVDDLLYAVFDTRPHALVDRARPFGIALLGIV
jgi:hypothetical protein